MKKILISLLGILLIGSFAYAELEMPKTPTDLKIVSYRVYFKDTGELDRVEVTGNLLKGDEQVKSGEKDITKSLTQKQIDQFTDFKDLVESKIKTQLGLVK